MSEKHITVRDGTTVEGGEQFSVRKQKIDGYLVFYRASDGVSWTGAFPVYPVGIIPPANCPIPLFQTRQTAIDEASKYLPNGGEIIVFRVRE